MKRLLKFKAIFWDFDGVIKDSNEVKDRGYYELMKPFGKVAAKLAVEHNQQNGGMSRFDKIPFYLKHYAKISFSANDLEFYFREYSRLTIEGVVKSPYRAFIYDYIKENHLKQEYYIVTGSSDDDIKEIVEQLKINKYFRKISGSPASKISIISSIIGDKGYKTEDCAMVGDATIDRLAAEANRIAFFWVACEENLHLFKDLEKYRLENG